MAKGQSDLEEILIITTEKESVIDENCLCAGLELES